MISYKLQLNSIRTNIKISLEYIQKFKKKKWKTPKNDHLYN